MKRAYNVIHGAMLEQERGGAGTVQGADERQSRSTKLRPCEGKSASQKGAAYLSNDHKLLREAENKPRVDRRPQEGRLTDGRQDFK